MHPCERANNKLEDHAGIVFGAGVGVGLSIEDLIQGGMSLDVTFCGTAPSQPFRLILLTGVEELGAD